MKILGAVLSLLGYLVAHSQVEACEGTCMSVMSIPAASGDSSVAVEVVGRADEAIRGFSLALGHDSSQLRLTRIEIGPLFASAELISATIRNQLTPDSDPFGAFFAIFDSVAPLDQSPVDIAEPTVLATFYYDVEPAASPGATPIVLENRAFGERPVSVLYVNSDNLEVFPELSSGEIVVCEGGEIASITPDHGAIGGGDRITIRGSNFGLSSEVFFGPRRAAVVQIFGTERIEVTTPAALEPGPVSVAVLSNLGCSVEPSGFNYELGPVLTAIEPDAGAGNQMVVIRGEGFAPETTAFVGALELSSVEVEDTSTLTGFLGSCELQVDAGPYDVRVENFNGGASLPAAFSCSAQFVRGECNGDGEIDIGDAVFELFLLFSGAPAPDCLDACDLDDSGSLDISDVIFLLDFLFRSGAVPPLPFPDAGLDLTSDLFFCGNGDA